MKLTILGSSSQGNSYLLSNEEETLLLECGVKFPKIQRALKFNFNQVVGCLLTHEHADHSIAVKDILLRGVDVYTSHGTSKAVGLVDSHHKKIMKTKEAVTIGTFEVMPFDVEHDASEPFGFLIKHDELGKLLFITDSKSCKYRISGLNHILIECNFEEELLDNSDMEACAKQRIFHNHFSFEAVCEFLDNTDLRQTKNIVLLHASSSNADYYGIKQKLFERYKIQVFVADANLVLDLIK